MPVLTKYFVHIILILYFKFVYSHFGRVQLSLQRRQIQIAPIVRVVQPDDHGGQQGHCKPGRNEKKHSSANIRILCSPKCERLHTTEPTDEEQLQHKVAIVVHDHARHHRDHSQSQILHGLATASGANNKVELVSVGIARHFITNKLSKLLFS